MLRTLLPALLAASLHPSLGAVQGAPSSDSGQDQRAAYVEVFRLLEKEPDNLPGRHTAAKLSLEMASPALALDHVAYAIARLEEPGLEAPMLRLSALAHEALGEPEAAWNSLERLGPEHRDKELAKWQQLLAAQHFHIGAMDEIAARASKDLEDLTAASSAQLWRAALVQPAEVENELDRRLAGAQSDEVLVGGFALRAKLWLERARQRRSSIDDWAPLRSVGPWLKAAERLPKSHDLRVLADVLQRPFDTVPTEEEEAATRAPRLMEEEYEMPPPPADPMAELDLIQRGLKAAVASMSSLEPRLKAAMESPGPKGPELPAAIAEALALIEEIDALDLKRQNCSAPVYALRGEEGKAAEAALDGTTKLLVQLGPPKKALRSSLDSAARVAVGALVTDTMQRIASSPEENWKPEEVIAATDALAIWGDPSRSMPEDLWRDRASALIKVDPPVSPFAPSASTMHALHWLSGLYSPEDIHTWLSSRRDAGAALAGSARKAFAGGDYAEALALLESAIQHSPMDETLLRERATWLTEVGGPHAGAQALAEWWHCASPLDELPLAEMELFYRVGAWSQLLSISETALKDWPLSSEGFRFHSLAAAALDLPAAEQRVEPYLRRSERGETQLLEQALRRGLASVKGKTERLRSWLTLPSVSKLNPADDLAVQAAFALHDRAKGKETYLFSDHEKVVKRSRATVLGAALAEGKTLEEIHALGQTLSQPALADFAAAASAEVRGYWSAQLEYWEKCERHQALPPALRTFAARQVTRRKKRVHPTIRGRDAIYVRPVESPPSSIRDGRLLVSMRDVSIGNSGGGIVRFLGTAISRPVGVRVPGLSAPVVILRHSSCGESTGYAESTCAWILRDSTLRFPLPLLGPLDAASCAIVDTAKLGGTAKAHFEDLLIGERAALEIARPASMERVTSFGQVAKVELQEGGQLRLDGAVIDLRDRRTDAPWLSPGPGSAALSDVTVLAGAKGGFGPEDPNVRVIDAAPESQRTVTVTTTRELMDALTDAQDGDRVELVGGPFTLIENPPIARSIELVGRDGSETRLRIRETNEGSLRIRSGHSLTLRNLKVYGQQGGLGGDGRVPLRRIHVEPRAVLQTFDTSFVIGSHGPVTLYVDKGAVASLNGSSTQALTYVEQGGALLLENTRVEHSVVDGPGRVAVHRRPSIVNSETRVQLRGNRLRIAARPEDYRGDHFGSSMSRFADASFDARCRAAEVAFDGAIAAATQLEDRLAAARRFSAEIYAAGKQAGATDAAMEERFFARFKPLIEGNRDESYPIAVGTRSRFTSIVRLMDVVGPETRNYLRTSAKVGLRNTDRITDNAFITLATKYELAYPLHHPDRSRSQSYLKEGLAFAELAPRIASDKREEARVAEEKRRRRAAALEAQRAATAAVLRAEEARVARARAWNARSSYQSSYSSSSYIAAPSSYNSSYYSNQAFYSRLNSFSGGGSYRVSASGVTYR